MQTDINSRKTKIQVLTNKINDLEELSGQGSEEDRRRRKAMINAATTERATLQLEVTGLQKTLGCGAAAITPERITEILRGFAALLENAANGALGEDVVYKAFRIFRQLTGGRIWVHVERRHSGGSRRMSAASSRPSCFGPSRRQSTFTKASATTSRRRFRYGFGSRLGLTPLHSASIN